MARPQKEGLDYFPLDVKMDDEVKLIEAKFGIAGFGVLIKLYQIIYDNGYYINWTEREQLLYSNRINSDINLIIEVVTECIKWNLFNKEMYSKYEILTSKGIQKRFIEATQRRKEVNFYQEYLLLEFQKMYSEKVIVNINRVNVNINEVNTDIGTQRKEKKSKVKKSIVKHKYGEYENVLLTDDEIEKLKLKFTDWDKHVEILSQGIELKGYVYKSHYLAILKWAEKDKQNTPKNGYEGVRSL